MKEMQKKYEEYQKSVAEAELIAVRARLEEEERKKKAEEENRK